VNSLVQPFDQVPGNDVVDLSACRDTFRERFVERVFATEEQAQLAEAPDREKLAWLFWASKEAAFKVLSRLDRNLPFRWKSFVTRIEAPHRPLPSLLTGHLKHPAGVVSLEMELEADYVHVRAGLNAVPAGAVNFCPANQDESTAVRTLALAAFASRYGRTGQMDQKDGLPVIVSSGLCIPVSLSHHGRFLAVAFF